MGRRSHATGGLGTANRGKTRHSREWQYTPTDQPALVRYPSGNQVSYRYDSKGLLQCIDGGFGPGATTIATYDKPDASGRYLSARVANTVAVKHVYDGGHESERSIHTRDGDIVESYSYDVLGRLTEVKRRDETEDGRRQSSATLAYDVRDQLTLESRDGAAGHVSLSYGLDTLGRRVSKITATDAGSGRQDYGYGNGSRLQTATSTAATAIQWDAFDRPQNDQHRNRFAWGLADHLRSITAPDGRHEDMLFDADGQRERLHLYPPNFAGERDASVRL